MSSRSHSAGGRKHITKAFTLVELLVVIGIIALLISMLLPALNRVRGQSYTVKCGSQLRQLGLAFTLYANEHRGRLPTLTDNTVTEGLPARNGIAWHNLVAPYMGRRNPDRTLTRFGYNGFNPVHDRFMPCPAREPDQFFDQTYGVNYINVFSHHWIGPEFAGFWKEEYNGSARLNKVPAYVFLAADVRNLYNLIGSSKGGRTEILNPAASGSWALTYDYDKDGVLDTAVGELFAGVGPYNGLAAIHGKRMVNFLFADGAVKLLRISQWARNEGGMWGKGLPYTCYK
jgi:prepilin-type N-terminal cleavage/methylation domain-containing protein/prepilin-type processing-associated H-X9-DG protein